MRNLIYVAILGLAALSCHQPKVKSVSLVPNQPEPYVQDRKSEFKGASETNFGGAEGSGTGSSYSSGYVGSEAAKDTADNPKQDSLINSKQPFK